MNRREFLAAAGTAAVGVSGVEAAAPKARRAFSLPDLSWGETLWPTAAELQAFAEESARAQEAAVERPLFKHVVVRPHTDWTVGVRDDRDGHIGMTEFTIRTREPGYGSMQGRRGLEGAPLPARGPGPLSRQGYAITGGLGAGLRPARLFGCYGEYAPVDLTSKWPTHTSPSGPDRRGRTFAEACFLVARRYDRYEWAVWSLLSQFGRGHSHPARVWVVAGGTPWTDPHCAPLRSATRDALLACGKLSGANFDERATAYMNATTADVLCAGLGLPTRPDVPAGADTTTDWDVRVAFQRTYQSRLDAEAEGWGGPRMVRMPSGYLADGRYNSFIPDGRVVVFGHRDVPSPVGAYLVMRNANCPDMEAQPYTRLVEGPDGHEVHDGHNGGPVLDRPRDVVVMDVF